MSEKVKDMQKRLKENGYFASEELSKTMFLFEAAGKRSNKSIPTLLLQGKSGSGKTFLAETFAKMIDSDERFVQCFPRMGTENFQYDVDIKGAIKQDADNCIKPGILLQALEKSHEKPVVLVIDELDKARPDVDSFFLDFLENGRLTTGTDTYERGDYPIYTIITSNDKRQIDEALLNRSKKVVVPRPSREMFLEILGLPEDHYMTYIYNKCPNFSIRQAKQYLEDLEALDEKIDLDALSQYINLDELGVKSVAEFQRLTSEEKIEFERPNLAQCEVRINDNTAAAQWINLLNSEDGANYKLFSDENDDIYVAISTIKDLKRAKENVDFSDYEGWLEDDLESSKIKEENDENVIWANNKSTNNGTKLGIKVVGDTIFRLAKDNDKTYVYLNSWNKELESYLGNDLQKGENEYDRY